MQILGQKMSLFRGTTHTTCLRQNIPGGQQAGWQLNWDKKGEEVTYILGRKVEFRISRDCYEDFLFYPREMGSQGETRAEDRYDLVSSVGFLA